MMDELPEGWAITTLGEIAEVTGGITKGQKRHAGEKLRSIQYLRVANVQRGYLDLGEIKEIEATEDEIAHLRLLPGDILFTEGGDRDKLGRGWIWSGEIKECIHQNHIFRARLLDPRIESKYVSLFSNIMGKDYFDDKASQTVNLASINITKLKSLPISLPPHPEQRRIVAKVEQLLAQVNAARDRLSRVPSILKRFRQSVLAAACSGELTADWREKATKSDLQLPEPVNPKVIVQVEELFDTPENWRWLPLQAFCDPNRAICYGVIKLGSERPDGVPCLRTSDVKPLWIDTSSVKCISPEISDQFKRTLLCGNEILVNVRGTLGGVAVVPDDMRNWNISREIALVPVAGVVPRFVAFWIASLPCQNWLSEVAKGVAYTGINIEDLRQLPIALISTAEQHEIVRRVEKLFGLADNIENQVATTQKRVDRMSQAVLSKAFRGELVPTEAELARAVGRGYEAGEELLTRIKKEGGDGLEGKAVRKRKSR